MELDVDENEPSLRNSFLRMSLLVDQAWWPENTNHCDAYLWENLKLWKQAVQENCPEFSFPPDIRHPLIRDDAQRESTGTQAQAQAHAQTEDPAYTLTQVHASASGPGPGARRTLIGENSLAVPGPSNQSPLNQKEERFETNEEESDEKESDEQEPDEEGAVGGAYMPSTSTANPWNSNFQYSQGRSRQYSPSWNRGRGGRTYYRSRYYFPRWSKRGRRGRRGGSYSASY